MGLGHSKHEFLIILQISSGHTNLYISDLGVIVQFSKNKKAYIFYKKTKITNFSWSYELVGLCWTDGAIFKEREMGAEQEPSFCANLTSPGDSFNFIVQHHYVGAVLGGLVVAIFQTYSELCTYQFA